MSRPELVALLADVKENPDDLTPWLVLTDWLEENGDDADRARAEYCRLCFDKLGKKQYASDWEKGERRRELYRQFHDVWLGGFHGLIAGPLSAYPRCQIKRGLLQVHVTAPDLFEVLEGEIPPELGHWIERIEVSQLSSELVVELAGHPILEGPAFVALHAASNVKLMPSAILALAQSPGLANVRELVVTGGVLGERRKALRPLKDRFGQRFRSS